MFDILVCQLCCNLLWMLLQIDCSETFEREQFLEQIYPSKNVWPNLFSNAVILELWWTRCRYQYAWNSALSAYSSKFMVEVDFIDFENDPAGFGNIPSSLKVQGDRCSWVQLVRTVSKYCRPSLRNLDTLSKSTNRKAHWRFHSWSQLIFERKERHLFGALDVLLYDSRSRISIQSFLPVCATHELSISLICADEPAVLMLPILLCSLSHGHISACCIDFFQFTKSK